MRDLAISVWRHSSKFQSLLVFLLMIAAMTALSDRFFTAANGWNIMRQISVNLCLSIGMTMIIIAGGIGLCPTRSMIKYILDRRDDFKRFLLFFGARNPESQLFLDDLDAWRTSEVWRAILRLWWKPSMMHRGIILIATGMLSVCRNYTANSMDGYSKVIHLRTNTKYTCRPSNAGIKSS